jgi:pimeloyl-ACP methyl ester carboxylesterase
MREPHTFADEHQHIAFSIGDLHPAGQAKDPVIRSIAIIYRDPPFAEHCPTPSRSLNAAFTAWSTTLPPLSFLRALFALVSLIILGVALYLLWTWYQGDWVRDADNVVRRAREDWRLWTGGALLVWSFLGRFVIRLLLARSDTDPMRVTRGDSQLLESPTGARLHIETYGPADGQPLVLTHGWSLDSRIWYYAKRDLAKRFRVIVWDLPGLGASKRAGSKIDMNSFAQDLATVIGTTGRRPVILVGHSIGGMIIQTLARDRPEMFGREVAGVVLLNTTYINPLRTMILSGLANALRWPIIEPMLRLTILLQPLAWLSSWQSYLSGSAHVSTRFGFGRYVTRSQLDATTLLMTLNSPAVSAHGDLAMFRWDSKMALARTGVPVLIVGGSKDIVTKPDASRTIAAAVPYAQLRVVEEVNHMGPVERAGEYHEAIATFADTVSAVGAG